MLYITYYYTHPKGGKTEAEGNQVTHPSFHCYEQKDQAHHPRLNPWLLLLHHAISPKENFNKIDGERKGAGKKIESKSVKAVLGKAWREGLWRQQETLDSQGCSQHQETWGKATKGGWITS